MAEMREKKKRLSVNHSFLTLTDSTKQTSAHKSPKKFDVPNGVVGLGILAALNDHLHHHHLDPVFINGSRTSVLAISPKSSSNSIPILSKKKFSKDNSIVEEMELCEEYTCVISHVGENFIKKREYFEAEILENNNGSQRVCIFTGNGGGGGGGFGAVSESSTSGGGGIAAFGIADFLNSCFLCAKPLHGLDIFMYRGEKAFCSAECRYRQMCIDEKNEKCQSGVKKKTEYSVSPCSGTLQFIAGVAAA